MSGLLHRGFVVATGRRRLPDVVRYLAAMAYRLEKLPANAVRDELAMRQVAAVTAESGGPGAAARHGGARRPRRADPLDGRGAAGRAVRPERRHPAPGLRAAHLQGDRRPAPLTAGLPPTPIGEVLS